MAVTVRNIIVGAGNLYVASTDNTKPPISAAPAAGQSYKTVLDADANWRNVGATMNGVEIAYTPSYGEVDVDQLKDAAILFNQGVQIMMNTQMAESTLANLLVAWGFPSTNLVNAGDTLNIGVPIEAPVERAAVVVGRAPATVALGTRERLYYARRIVSMQGSNHSLRRTEATVFPVSFRLLPDPTYSGSEYGTITDRTV
jgi:hypothetical protein